ncbi:uncharacterized protein A4U43_C06F3550 [Asparagus officinalis]|uniref:Uncharacterized protein n=1 Tax=Asparagus officinalis TaxID=4686 RepID=A0A5P1EPS5_ASPOF|nr:uncharacterized protein A4U43_C06F3550 [Asparagus officinalis]
MYCFLRLTLLLSVTIVSVGSPTEKSPAAFFIFGDSVVDVGNNNYIETIPEFKANYAPYGRNSFFNRPTGRFNDGRLMVDFIAEYAKLPLIPPFMQPSAQFTNGANFASGGAGVLPDTSQGLVINFQAQLKQFEEVSGMFIKELGEERARAIIEDAVYFISIGSNDYIIGYLSHEKNREAYTPEEFIGMVIGNFTQSIQELYEKGARKFYILSIADLGCLPAFRAINPKADGGCFKDASALALAHNQALSAVLTSFEYIHKDFKSTTTNSPVGNFSTENVMNGFSADTSPPLSENGSGIKGKDTTEMHSSHSNNDAAHSSDNLNEFSDSFVHWVTNGETLCF